MISRLTAPLLGEQCFNVPLEGLNSWRVGGTAERLYRPADVNGLGRFLRKLPVGEPITWLGLGTNLLTRDGGVRGTVVATHAALDAISYLGSYRLRAEAGVPCTRLAHYCMGSALTGAEFMVGIPGTLGGALAMNAGAFGGQTWDIVTAVETIDRQGRIRRRAPTDFMVAYREARPPSEEWFVAAELDFRPGDKKASLDAMRTMLAQRQATQPLGIASCGSVFRNPPGDFAGRLIDAAGLKGHRIGGACVSSKHANFILNTGKATAGDIEALIEFVQRRVQAVHGTRLAPEVRIVGQQA